MGDIETKNRDAASVAVVKKANREEVIERAANKCGFGVGDMTNAMAAIESVIKEIAMEGRTVCLTGLGKFYLQRHKGHPVRFVDSEEPVANYLVYKFSASNVWNATLREADKKNPIVIQ